MGKCAVSGSRWSRAVAVAAAMLAVAILGGATARADPLGWTSPLLIDPANPAPLNAVSCPSAGLCLGVDGSGDLVTSTNPTQGAAAWVTTDIDGTGSGLSSLTSVSCASASFCASGDLNGNVLTTTAPGNPAVRWSVANIASDAISGVSCPSSSLCVAVDQTGNVYTSANPGVAPPPGATPTSTAPTSSPVSPVPRPRSAWPSTAPAPC